MFKEEKFWFSLLIFINLIFWIPRLEVQPWLSTGDMGKDFYAFAMSFGGALPCRDYWWQYGPLMPFYYAFWFLIGGVNILSVRMGLALLYFLSSLFAYRALRLFTSPAVAFLYSLPFLDFNMTWTFNHVGAIPLLLLTICFLWKFFLTQKVHWCYLGTLTTAGMALVKMSVGLTSFFALYAAALLGLGSLVGKKRRIFARRDFFLLPLLFGFVSLVGYGIIFFGVPLKWIDQCLMLSAKYRDVWAPSPWTSFKHLILRIFIWEPERMVWLLFFGLLGILAYFGLKRKKPATAKTDLAGMALLSLGLFALANSTEYFATDGLIYRFDFWIFPILVLLAGILSEWGSRVLSRPIKWVFGVLFLLLVLSSPLGSLRQAFASRVPERYLNLPRGRIYVGGSLSDLEVVKRTSSFIKENTEPGQEILAIPYDPLYCFLSERRHAVPELMFVESARMSDAREEEIIKVIETKQIPLILISNRYRSSEGGIGHFGQTHGKKLAQYIFSHYQDAETLGNWLPDSGRHSVKIFRRKV